MKKLGFLGRQYGGGLDSGLLDGRVFAASALIASDIDRGRRQRLKRIFKIDVTDSNTYVVSEARALLIAVKPQNIDEVLAQVKAGAELAGSQRSTGTRIQAAVRSGCRSGRLAQWRCNNGSSSRSPRALRSRG